MGKKIIFAGIITIVVLVFLCAIFFIWQKNLKSQVVEKKKVYHVALLQMASIVSQNIDGFKQGMQDLGYREGVNIEYTYRDANGDPEILKQYVKEIVDSKPDLIFVNTSPATMAVKEATAGTNIPVVFSMVADPIGAGLVQSIQSSGNNLTGTSCAYVYIASYRLDILKEVFPKVKRVLVYYRPEDKSGAPATKKIIERGNQIGIEVIAKEINKKEDIEEQLKTLKPGDIDAIMDPADSVVTSAFETIIQYANNLKIPYMGLSKGEAEKGATITYGVDYIDLGKQSSLIANQVLNKIKPSDIPFEQPRRWYFVINKQASDRIGISIAPQEIRKADLIVN